MSARPNVAFLVSLLALGAGCSMVAGVHDLAYVDPASTTSPNDPSSPNAAPEAGVTVTTDAAAPSPPDEDAAPLAVDAGADAPLEAAVDAEAPPPVDEPPPVVAAAACTGAELAANDRRGPLAVRVITLAPGGAQYSPRCLRIRAGQSVTFLSDFGANPLEARSQNPPSPITPVNAGASATFTFAKGTYLYGSAVNPALGGTVDVRP